MASVDEAMEPPIKKTKMNDESFSQSSNFTSDDIEVIENQVNSDELDQLRQFQVLDEVSQDHEDSSDGEVDSSEEEEVPADEIEKMLEENLPEELKAPPKPKQKPYEVKKKIVLQEKGKQQSETLPVDWLIIYHSSGIPIYLHRPTRVCTLSRPYFLGGGSAKNHDIPLSAIPCLSYRRSLEAEERQKQAEETIAETLRNGQLTDIKEPTRLTDDIIVDRRTNTDNNLNEKTNTLNKEKSKKCPFSSKKSFNEDTDQDKGARNEFTSDKEDQVLTNIEVKKTTNESNNCEESDMGEIKINDNENQENNCNKNSEIIMDSQKNEVTNVLCNEKNDFTNEIENSVSNGNTKPNDSGKQSLADIPSWQRPVILPGGVVLAATKVETAQENWKNQHLTHEQVHDYCKNLFQFQTINIMRFKHWSDRHKYAKARKIIQRPLPPEGTKLITITQPDVNATGQPNNQRKGQREWVMNMQGQSYVCIFYEYVRRALHKQPTYHFQQLENAATPYKATVMIGDMQYGVGYGSSKRQAKSEAAKASIQILIPEMRDQIQDNENQQQDKDFAFFDYVGIEDPRIANFCTSMMEPSPHAILRTCLLRNFGLCDRQIQYEMKKLKHHQKLEFTMKVGKHTATVVCKNKKIGKQRASQAILQALHPHIKSWGSLLRLYGSRSVKSCKEKKVEEQQITLLQDKATVNQPNYAILEKLRAEMQRLYERDKAVAPIGTLVLTDDLPEISASNLNNVEI